MTKSSLRKTAEDYSSSSSLHGVGYILQPGQPSSDRLFWTLCVAVSLTLAAYWSAMAHKDWRDKPVITSLENSALPIEDVEHPAITICGQGFNMQHVYDVMEKDFLDWVRKKKRTNR